MDNANLYAQGNNLQYHDVNEIVKEYFHLIKFSETGGDMIMDIGCGDGKVTIDILHKRLPSNIRKLIAVDILPQMVKHAKETYSHLVKNVEFRVLDIGGDISDEYINGFHCVFSFYCLHWVLNQRKCLTNIWSLLKDKGDCLLCFNGKNAMYDLWQSMAKKPRWLGYCKKVNNYISPYHLSIDPTQQCKSLMEDIGFRNVQVDTRKMTYHFHGEKDFKRFASAIDPFFSGIPTSQHDDYLEDMLQEVRDLRMVVYGKDNNGTNGNTIIELKYILIICYANK